ncbi:MAG: MFS transporter [bacterium]|nr:MFS transporter [bacterium]
MHSLHVYQARKFHKFFHTDMWRFDLSIWMHVIARSSISIFIPIFLLDIGYSLSAVLAFYLAHVIVDIPLNFLLARLIQKIGAIKVYLIGTAAIIAFFALFAQLEMSQWYLFGSLVLLISIYDACYWVSHLYLFEKVSHKTKNISDNTGILYTIKYFAAMLGPAIGAIVLIAGSSKHLMALSIFIFILSAIPLFRMKIDHEKPSKNEVLLSPKRFFKESFERRNFLSMALWGFHKASEAVIWPVFIYITFLSLEAVAIVPIIISVTSMIFSYVAGKFAHRNRERIIAICAIIIAAIWILRLLGYSFNFYFASVFLVGFFALFLSVSLYSNIFERGSKVGMLSTSTYLNAVSMFGQLFIFLILYFAVAVFKVDFLLTAIGLMVLGLANTLYSLSKPKKS